MCTLILGRDVIAPGTAILAANRDEDPARPADSPAILRETPRIAGGRDRRAGGTWLAVRDGTAVAMLNRRGDSGSPASGRSRGLLTIEVAEAAGLLEAPADSRAVAALADRAREYALAAVEATQYMPFSLVFAARDRAWVLSWDGAARVLDIGPGWHVITHTVLDDVEEPRVRRLRRELEGWRPTSPEEAERGLIARLAEHDDPAVCIHEGRMSTVSHSLVWLGPGITRYGHGEGRPCERAPLDYSHLLVRREDHA